MEEHESLGSSTRKRSRILQEALDQLEQAGMILDDLPENREARDWEVVAEGLGLKPLGLIALKSHRLTVQRPQHQDPQQFSNSNHSRNTLPLTEDGELEYTYVYEYEDEDADESYEEEDEEEEEEEEEEEDTGVDVTFSAEEVSVLTSLSETITVALDARSKTIEKFNDAVKGDAASCSSSEDDDDDEDDEPTGTPLRQMYRFNSFIERREGRKLIDHYSVDSYIAKGSYGVVCAGTHKETGTVRAIKELKKSKRNQERNLQCIREFNILKDLDHPNILRMYELFEERKRYYIISELCNGGDLKREINSTHGPYTEMKAALLMREVLSCVNYCHKNRIVHRDLKPGNILLEESKQLDQIKIIDFGEATTFEEHTRLTEIAGTIAYMAPEVLKMSYGPKCDIWSCGVIAYFVLSGQQPFKGASDEETCDNIMKGKFSFPGPVWDRISDDAKDFIRKLLTWDEHSRPSAEEALQQPWITEAINNKRPSLKRRDSLKFALGNLQDFKSNSRLNLATSTFIASQIIQKEEKEMIDEAFRQMDSDRSGHLTKDDVRAAYMECFGSDISDRSINKMFDQVDVNCTGAIEYSEFVVGALGTEKLLTTDNLERAFSRFDKDGKGTLSRSNIHDILEEAESISSTEADLIIDQVDIDGDGQVSFDDFVSHVQGGETFFRSSRCHEDLKKALDPDIMRRIEEDTVGSEDDNSEDGAKHMLGDLHLEEDFFKKIQSMFVEKLKNHEVKNLMEEEGTRKCVESKTTNRKNEKIGSEQIHVKIESRPMPHEKTEKAGWPDKHEMKGENEEAQKDQEKLQSPGKIKAKDKQRCKLEEERKQLEEDFFKQIQSMFVEKVECKKIKNLMDDAAESSHATKRIPGKKKKSQLKAEKSEIEDKLFKQIQSMFVEKLQNKKIKNLMVDEGKMGADTAKLRKLKAQKEELEREIRQLQIMMT